MKLKPCIATVTVAAVLLSTGATAVETRPLNEVAPRATELHALALAELRTIQAYLIDPADLTIGALAQRFHFEHSVEQCMEVPKHQSYCLYTITAQQSAVARIITLGIGHSKASNLPGARIDWTPWSDHVCIDARDLEPILGRGEVINVNVPYVAPGSSATPPAYRTILYTTIPSAVRGAQAKVAFRGNCVTEISFNF